MCFPHDALPPIPAIAGGAVDAEDLVLEASDGNPFAAFIARPEAPNGAGMVVLPDIRGLYPFYEELAIRFAEQGVNSVAIDYFGRTAGVGKRDADFPWMEHVPKTRQDELAKDVAAAVAYLRSEAGGSCTSIFTVGFCFGGSTSWNQAAYGHALNGVIGFYGRPGPGFDGSPGPKDRVRDFHAPVLALMGGADQGIPVADIEAFREAMNEAGVENEVVIYEGAPHSFFDRAFEQFAKESADAWDRMLAFIAARR